MCCELQELWEMHQADEREFRTLKVRVQVALPESLAPSDLRCQPPRPAIPERWLTLMPGGMVATA